MNFRHLIKLFVPPIILSLVNRNPLTEVEFETYDQASVASQQGSYEELQLVNVVVEKNIIFRKNLECESQLNLTSLRTLIPLASIQIGEDLKVIDFGGGGGMHYFLSRKILGPNIPIRWNIVETKTMVKLSQKNSGTELKFFENLEDAKADLMDVDLVFTSSALQYCPDPLDALKRLVNLDSQYLFVTRTPFLEEGGTVVTRQNSRLSDNGPGPLPDNYEDKIVTYPITYVSKILAEKIIGEKYVIRYTVDEGESGFKFKDKKISLTGYFCVRRTR